MPINYGLTYCRKVLKTIKQMEDIMFEEKGHGLEWMSDPHRCQIEFQKLLNEFEKEKAAGLPPSYDPNVHVAWCEVC